MLSLIKIILLKMFNSPESWHKLVIAAQKQITEDFDQAKLTKHMERYS